MMGTQIISIYLSILNNGALLSDLNHTIVVLIPKIISPTMVSDFQPLSLCNVIYRVIAKVIANKLKLVLGDVISQNQSAFIPLPTMSKLGTNACIGWGFVRPIRIT